MNISNFIELCLLPILIILVKYVATLLKVKRQQLESNTSSEIAQKYTEMLYETISKCVTATNQTYVNSLKESNSFDAEAQKTAFQQTLIAVKAILTEQATDYISNAVGDIDTYLTSLIEAEVSKSKITGA